MLHKMIAWLGWFIALLAVLALGFFLGKDSSLLSEGPDKPDTVIHSDIVLKEVQSMGQLELTRYLFKDIIQLEKIYEDKSLLDYFTNSGGTKQFWEENPKVVLIAHGSAIACINLQEIGPSHIEVQDSVVFLTLPAPRLCHYKIDHQKSRIYEYRDESNLDPNKQLLEEAFQMAEQQVRQSALEAGILDDARPMARRLLEPLLMEISQKKVYITFEKKGKDLLDEPK